MGLSPRVDLHLYARLWCRAYGEPGEPTVLGGLFLQSRFCRVFLLFLFPPLHGVHGARNIIARSKWGGGGWVELTLRAESIFLSIGTRVEKLP